MENLEREASNYEIVPFDDLKEKLWYLGQVHASVEQIGKAQRGILKGVQKSEELKLDGDQALLWLPLDPVQARLQREVFRHLTKGKSFRTRQEEKNKLADERSKAERLGTTRDNRQQSDSGRGTYELEVKTVPGEVENTETPEAPVERLPPPKIRQKSSRMRPKYIKPEMYSDIVKMEAVLEGETA